MGKTGWIIGICATIFVFVTVFVLSLEDTGTVRRVKFANGNVEINHTPNGFKNSNNTQINFGNTNINNQDIPAKNKDVSIKSDSNLENSDVEFSNSDYEYNNQDSSLSNNSNINYKNLDDTKLDEIINTANNFDNRSMEQPAPQRRYLYKNIDWNTWKSNFVNQILEDSLSIKELDLYNEGAWFYYSFEVDKNGRISNVIVRSVYLTFEDRQKVAELIKSYQYKDITVFPANTKRTSAKVSAVMMLSDTTKKSSPKDFNDYEKIKLSF